MHKCGVLQFASLVCRWSGGLVEAGQLVWGYFHNALATAAIEDILAAGDLLYLLAIQQGLLIIRLIEHLVDRA